MNDSGRRARWRRFTREVLSLAVFCVLLLAGRSSLADHYRIPTGSMLPTVAVGARVVVNKAAYQLRVPFTDWSIADTGQPEHGDVVVVDSPEDDRLLLKRIVAVPGNEVSVRGGALLLNGRRVPLSQRGNGEWEALGGQGHLVLRTHGGGDDFGPVVVPPGQYLLVGDNRGDSRDGRAFGFVDGGAIRGRATAVYYDDGFTWRSL